MALIFYLSAQPDLPHVPAPWLDVLVKKMGHAGEFALLFLLLFRAWRWMQTWMPALDVAWLSTAAYAVSDELHQRFVPGRHGNVIDMLIDVSGALLLWWLLRRRGERRFPRQSAQEEDLAE